MRSADEADFVVFGPLGGGSAVGYADRNGALVEFRLAQAWSYGEAAELAGQLAAQKATSFYAAPLLFGTPDAETAICFAPPD